MRWAISSTSVVSEIVMSLEGGTTIYVSLQIFTFFDSNSYLRDSNLMK